MINRAKFHFDNIYEKESKKFGPFLVYQIGDLSCDSGYYVAPHTQRVYEISYIVSGRGLFRVSDNEYRVERDVVFLNTIGDVHSIKSSDDDPLRYFYLGFNFDRQALALREYQSFDSFFSDLKCRELRNFAGIRDLFIRLFNELLSNDEMSDAMIETYLMQIVATTIRNFNKMEQRRYQPQKIFDTREQFIYNVVNYVDTKIANIQNLTELSNEFGYSYSYIEHLFSEVMGESLKGYCRRRKFEKAAEMITLDTSVTRVAEDLGYNSIHSFSRAFHKYYGFSPSEYKRKQKTKAI